MTDILCVGDVVDGEGDPNRCFDLLQDHGVICVAGNHERWMLSNDMRSLTHSHRMDELSPRTLTFVRSLPKSIPLMTASGELLLCHGLEDNDMNRLTPDDFGYALACNEELQALMASNRFRYIVGGHTHKRMVRRFGDLLVINAGTLSRRGEPSAWITDFSSQQIRLVQLSESAPAVLGPWRPLNDPQ